MNKNQFGWPFWLLAFVALTALGLSTALYLKSPRIAYVRSHDLISKYKGTLEAQSMFQKKKNSLLANADSLRSNFERSRAGYTNAFSRLNASQRSQQEEMLRQQQEQLIQYQAAIDQKIEEEDATMMDGVLGQVNSYVEQYAKQNNYDVVLGTTLSGSLLYGSQYMDVTEVVLAEMNEKYEGKK